MSPSRVTNKLAYMRKLWTLTDKKENAKFLFLQRRQKKNVKSAKKHEIALKDRLYSKWDPKSEVCSQTRPK